MRCCRVGGLLLSPTAAAATTSPTPTASPTRASTTSTARHRGKAASVRIWAGGLWAAVEIGRVVNRSSLRACASHTAAVSVPSASKRRLASQKWECEWLPRHQLQRVVVAFLISASCCPQAHSSTGRKAQRRRATMYRRRGLPMGRRRGGNNPFIMMMMIQLASRLAQSGYTPPVTSVRPRGAACLLWNCVLVTHSVFGALLCRAGPVRVERRVVLPPPPSHPAYHGCLHAAWRRDLRWRAVPSVAVALLPRQRHACVL